MRAGTNSHILVLKQWRLAPAFGCDARRALRRVIALGPHVHVLLVGFSVSSRCIMVLRHRVLDVLGAFPLRLLRPLRNKSFTLRPLGSLPICRSRPWNRRLAGQEERSGGKEGV